MQQNRHDSDDVEQPVTERTNAATDGQRAGLQGESAEAAVEAYYGTYVEVREKAKELAHSATDFHKIEPRKSVETELVEQDLDASEVDERTNFDGDVSEVVDGEDTAVVEVTLTLVREGETQSHTEKQVLATNEGKWRLLF